MTFMCVDWFCSRSEISEDATLDDFNLRDFLEAKRYRRPDRAYLVLDDDGVDTMVLPKKV